MLYKWKPGNRVVLTEISRKEPHDRFHLARASNKFKLFACPSSLTFGRTRYFQTKPQKSHGTPSCLKFLTWKTTSASIWILITIHFSWWMFQLCHSRIEWGPLFCLCPSPGRDWWWSKCPFCSSPRQLKPRWGVAKWTRGFTTCNIFLCSWVNCSDFTWPHHRLYFAQTPQLYSLYKAHTLWPSYNWLPCITHTT